MRNKLLFLMAFILSFTMVKAQTTIWSLDFESTGGYTTSETEFVNGTADYFTRTDGSDIGASFTNIQGSYYFAGQDIDDNGATMPVTLEIDDIDISGYSNLEFRVYLAEDDASSDEDWDDSDYVHFNYDIDNSGTFNNLIWIANDGSEYNSAPFIDTDFDGIGDGSEITDEFTQYTASIGNTGNLIDIKIEFNKLNSGDEDIAIDHLELVETGGSTGPSISNISISPELPTSSDPVTVSADITDDGTIDRAFVAWGTASETLEDTIEMSVASGDTYESDSDIPDQAEGTEVTYEITAVNDGDDSTKTQNSYIVLDPTPISEIQDTTGTGSEASPYADSTLLTSGIVVDTVSDAYYIQDGKGAWNGIKVMDADNTPNPGDSINIKADVVENYGFTRLEAVSGFTTISTGNDIPAADTVTTAEAATEKYEGVAIFIEGAFCNTTDDGYGAWIINDGSGDLKVDPMYYSYSPTLNAKYNVKGFGFYSFSDRRIVPTEGADVVAISPEFSNIATSPENPTPDDAVTISADIISETSTIDTAYLEWGTTSGSLNNSIGMVNTSGDTYEAESDIPAQSENTEVFYTITAGDNEEDTTATEEMSYTVSAPVVIEAPFLEDFEGITEGNTIGEEIEGWINYTEAGNETWEATEYSSNLYAQMSSNSTGEENITQMITPEIDISVLSEAEFTFDINVGYWTHNGLTVLISEDFDGTDVEGATWTDVTSNFTIPEEPTGGYGTFTNAGAMDISGYSGTIHIAFKYTGNDNDDETTTYQVDNVEIYDAAKPVISDYTTIPSVPSTDDDVDISAKVTDNSGSGLDTVFTSWGTTSGELENTIGMIVESGDTYITESAIPQQTAGTEVFYTITAVNNNEDTTEIAEQSYTAQEFQMISINDIQSKHIDGTDSSQYTGDIVTTSGIITATANGSYFVQDGKGPWNGIYVYDSDHSPEMGDEVELTGKVDEYYNLTQLKNINEFTVVSSGNELPAPDTITTGQANEEKYEGVLVRMLEVECTADTAEVGYGQWKAFNEGDTVFVDDLIYESGPEKGVVYNVTGLGYYSYSERKVQPRSADDVVPAGNIAPEISDVVVDPSEPEADEQVKIIAAITDDNPDDTITVTLKYGTSADDLSNSVDFTNTSGDDYGGIIPGQPAGTQVFFEIEASDGEDTTTYSGDYQVADDANAIIDEESLSLEVYPNPGSGQYSIEIDGETGNSYSVMVFNTVGKMVYNKEFNGQSVRQTINITDQNDGIYFLKVRSKDVDKVVKLIKE